MASELIVNHVECVDYAVPLEIVRSYCHIYKNKEQVNSGGICYGCTCTDSCIDEDTCMCVAQHGLNYDVDNKLLFLEDLVTDTYQTKPIFECNSCCLCPRHCPNRLVQRGLRFKLQVFETSNKGRGVRALENIFKGSYLVDYAGEVLDVAEAMKRIRAKPVQDKNYLLTVHENYGSQLIRTDIDANHFGNVSRFFNHSCDPNLLLHPVRIESVVPSLAFFARRDILSGEEITFDYSGGSGNKIPSDEFKKIPCRCYSMNCKGFLPSCNPNKELDT